MPEYETPSQPKPRKVRTLPPKADPQKQEIYNELARRGVFQSPEKQQIVQELARRGVVSRTRDVEINHLGAKFAVRVPAEMDDAAAGEWIRANAPKVAEMASKSLGFKMPKNGDPLGDPGKTGEPTTTRPIHQGDVRDNKSFVAANLRRNLADLGITQQQARAQGVSPAVQSVEAKRKQSEQKDIDAQIALARERQKHINDELTPQNYAADKKRAEKVGKVNTLNAARAGSLLNRAVPGTDEVLRDTPGVKGAIQQMAAGAVETLPETLALGGIGKSLEIGGALAKVFGIQGAIGTVESAANTDLRESDPAKYWTLLAGNAALTSAPFVKQWRENAIINGVADGKRSLPPKMALMIEQKAGLPKGSLASNPELARYAAATITGKPATMPKPAEKPAQPIPVTPPAAQSTKTPPVKSATPKMTQTPLKAEPQNAPGSDWLARVKALVEEAEGQTTAPAGESRLGLNAEGLSSLNSGINPIQAIKDADNLDFLGFEVKRPERDYGAQDSVRSPLSTGEQPGVYERLNPTEGKAVSEAFRNAQRGIEADTLQHGRTVEEINAFLDRTAQQRAGGKWSGKKLRPQIDSEFIDLVERQKNDPDRVAALAEQSDRGEALRRHDALTESIRQEIITERKNRGIPTPADWGIDGGYFPHIFLQDVVIRNQKGQVVGRGTTFTDAQKVALDHLKAHPGDQLTASARDVRSGDPTLRVSNGRYHKVVSDIASQVNLSHADIMSDLQGIVGKEGSRQKSFGSLQQRQGASGFSTDYRSAMDIYSRQFARWKHLSALKATATPKIEKIRADGQPGLAESMEDHLSQLWGTPSKAEKQVGNLIKEVPILRNHIANPDLAMRTLATRITRLQSFLKLDYNLKASAVNLLQPLQTLWARVSTRDLAAAYADYLKPATKQMLRDKGVFSAGTKLEGNTPQRVGKLSTPFQAASNTNRGVAYLAGLKEAQKQGLSPESAHKMGMDYAEMCEFDNSVYNAPQLLRSPQGRVLLQFKGYSAKMIESLFAEGGIANRGSHVPKGEKAAGILKYLTATTAVGGVKAVSAGGKLIGGYALINGLQSALQSQGMSEKEAQTFAETVYRGFPSLLDTDLSSSLSPLDYFEGNNTLDGLTKFVVGPNISTAADLADTGLRLSKAESGAEVRKILGKQAQKLTPLAKQADALQQMVTQPQGQVSINGRGGKPVNLSKQGGILRALGFPPLEQSQYWDKPKGKK